MAAAEMPGSVATGANLAEPANIVIFGATGDLTKRKLMPALARMFRAGLVHHDSRIIGVANNMASEEWHAMIKTALGEFASDIVLDQEWPRLSGAMEMVHGDLGDASTYIDIARNLKRFDGKSNVLFYLAIPPEWYGRVASHLGQAGLANQDEGYRRIVIEKPFGHDWESAHALNHDLQSAFNESQIYRIDHYLGKESVQNLLVFRFSNSILEPLWNRNYIDHVQISVSETLGIGYRAGYYENSGAMRDMIQSHMLQVMTLVAMEPPGSYTDDAVRTEKVKVLRAVRRIKPEDIPAMAVAAQYSAGDIGNERATAYCTEPGVTPDSTTETFAAMRLFIDNWRWQGVPFVLWHGKRLKKRASEVVIRFRSPPQNLFNPDGPPPTADSMVFRLQPDEGMFLRMNAKKPGLTTEMRRLVMRGPYASVTESLHEAYEILLHDVLLGDATLFSRSDEIEESWKIVDPILNVWKDRLSIERYRAGTWDVPNAELLFKDCIGGWHKPT